ncbi:MAG: PEP-CTERM sorting domain-containing protein [Planctomycetales bacterium]|nr:PEP-CTERM sorting domain-containing protein [Planctomycetales bacterium]
MTRKIYCAAATAVVSLVLCTQALGVVLPGIAGNVHDQSGAGLSGQIVQLYFDNGDGIFDPLFDSQFGGDVVTGADGGYAFQNIQMGKYFVRTGDSVSGLLDPGSPTLMIDDFFQKRSVTADPIGPISTSSLAVPASEVLGGERDLYVELISGIGDVELRVNPFGENVLQFDTSSGVNGRGVVTWDGVDNSGSLKPAMGLGGFDLTNSGQNEAFILKVGMDATGIGESMILRIYDDSMGKYSDLAIPFVVSGGRATEMVVASFDDFVGEVKPSKIDALQLILGQGTKSIDAQVDYVGVIGMSHQDFEVTAIPEPSSMALAVLGFGGILLRRRRR